MNKTPFQELSSQELMKICDAHFLTAEELASGNAKELIKARYYEPFDRFVEAFNELTKRCIEIRDWARGLLNHADYDARETGASLLGSLGARRLLGAAETQIVAELGALIQRPLDEDYSKELSAVDAAILTLASIGNRDGIAFMRWILLSDDPVYNEDEIALTAVETLCDLLSDQTFMDLDDPIKAARQWLAERHD